MVQSIFTISDSGWWKKKDFFQESQFFQNCIRLSNEVKSNNRVEESIDGESENDLLSGAAIDSQLQIPIEMKANKRQKWHIQSDS